MKKYVLWDRVSSINGVQAGHFLNEQPFMGYDGDIILIYADETGGRVTNVECKDILSQIYNIDKSLPLADFMNQYFAVTERINRNANIKEN